MENTMSFSDDTNYRDLGLLILRVGIGVTFIYFHGWSKLTGGPDTWKAVGKSMENLGIYFQPGMWGLESGVVEFLGGILLFFGFFFKPATFLLTLNLAIASVALLNSGSGISIYPVEMAILMLSLIFIGPGKFSLDYWRKRRRYLT